MARVDVYGWVEGFQVAGVDGEVLGVGIADVDCAGGVVGELVGGGEADAEGGVGAGYYYYFVFYPPACFAVSLR